MDLNGFRRRLPHSTPIDQRSIQSSPFVSTKYPLGKMNLTNILKFCLIALPLVVTLRLVLPNRPSDQSVGFADARLFHNKHQNGTQLGSGSGVSYSQPTDTSKDALLCGLLSPGFDDGSCLSRYQSSLYRKTSPYKPSSHLLSRLRSYENLHKQCGPYSKPYNETLHQLRSGQPVNSIVSECKYVVWISFSGLGNRILTLASAFLYALLTNRVLLVDPGKDMPDLFCEPFPEISWFLPPEFPLKNEFDSLNQKSHQSYGNMLKHNTLNTSTQSVPPSLYLHIVHDYDDHDKLFFCDDDQTLLSKVPWLILKTDNYFVPSLFLIPSFEQELRRLFPERETVFHHLGRYLFHPSNDVWGMITRYYQAYLGEADERIGIQIRVFESGSGPHQHVMDQILACTLKNKVLPEVNRDRSILPPSGRANLKAILVTSLTSGYSESLRNMYWEYPTVTGDVMGVYQPSHEEVQQSEKQLHNQKAWAEMYLLSLTDVLVTSAWSTFGYVAQGLGGMKPWILYKPENQKTPDMPCRQVMSMEPCFHAPPFYDCKAKRGVDTGALVPHVRHCEDMSWGLKLVDSHADM